MPGDKDFSRLTLCIPDEMSPYLRMETKACKY
jgi:hypothetical protein